MKACVLAGAFQGMPRVVILWKTWKVDGHSHFPSKLSQSRDLKEFDLDKLSLIMDDYIYVVRSQQSKYPL